MYITHLIDWHPIAFLSFDTYPIKPSRGKYVKLKSRNDVPLLVFGTACFYCRVYHLQVLLSSGQKKHWEFSFFFGLACFQWQSDWKDGLLCFFF